MTKGPVKIGLLMLRVVAFVGMSMSGVGGAAAVLMLTLHKIFGGWIDEGGLGQIVFSIALAWFGIGAVVGIYTIMILRCLEDLSEKKRRREKLDE